MDKKRKTNRLKGFDYTSKNYYFVTLITKDRKEILSKIDDYKIKLTPIGIALEKSIKSLDKCIEVESYIIMPNHLHIIINKKTEKYNLSDIIRWIKVNTQKISCQKNLWHKSFHETIIRDEESFEEIVKYIEDNPKNWDKDTYKF